MKEEISSTGFWNIEGKKFDKQHVFDQALCDEILKFANTLKIKKSYDFGCGHGKYVKAFRNADIEATGFDGNPATAKIPNCVVQDLTSDKFSIEPVKFILSLEVIEHIPAKFEDAFLNNVDKHLKDNGVVVLSWAIPGQPGFGHVNCKDNEYVLSAMEKRGYTFKPIVSKRFREAAKAWWFKKTIMVFQKTK